MREGAEGGAAQHDVGSFGVEPRRARDENGYGDVKN